MDRPGIAGVAAVLAAACALLAACPAAVPAPAFAPPVAGMKPAPPAPPAELVTPRYPRWPTVGAPTFSADGSRAAIVHEGRAYVVDLVDGGGRSRGDVHGPYVAHGWPGSAVISPDGSRVAVVVEDRPEQLVVVFDVETGARRATIQDADWPKFVLDGAALLVTVSKPRSNAQLVDAGTGAVLRTIGSGGAWVAGEHAFSSDRGGFTVWDLRSGARLATVGTHSRSSQSLGSTYAWLEGDTAHAYDLAGLRSIALAADDRCRGNGIAIDKDERTIGLVTAKADLCLWDVKSGSLRWVPRAGPPPKSAPNSLTISGAVASYYESDVGSRFVDLPTGAAISEAEFEAREAVDVSPVGDLGVSVDPPAVIERPSGKRLFSIDARGASFSPDGKAVGFRSTHFGLEVLDAHGGGAIVQVLPRAPALDGVARTMDHRGLVGLVGYGEPSVVLDAASLRPLRMLTGGSAHDSAGLALWQGDKQPSMVVVDSPDASPRTLFSTGRIVGTGLSPDGKWVAASVYDQTRPEGKQNYFTVAPAGGGAVREVPSPTKYISNWLEVSADGRFLLVSWPPMMDEDWIRAWEIDTGRTTLSLRDGERLVATPVGHQGMLVGGGLRRVDLESGQLGPAIDVPTQDATLAFRDDGKMLAVAAKGAWVTLFDLEHDTQRVVDDSEQVTLGAFSGDGSLLYGTRPDGIGVWRVADGAALLVATPFEKATLLRGADGRVELVGDAIAGAESLRCAAALHLVPFSVCRDAVVVPGVLERAMKTPMRAVRH